MLAYILYGQRLLGQKILRKLQSPFSNRPRYYHLISISIRLVVHRLRDFSRIGSPAVRNST